VSLHKERLTAQLTVMRICPAIKDAVPSERGLAAEAGEHDLDGPLAPARNATAVEFLFLAPGKRSKARAKRRTDFACRDSFGHRAVFMDDAHRGRVEKFITIASNLETGEPLWIRPGRRLSASTTRPRGASQH